MPVGQSGRVVIDLDPKQKAPIYAALQARRLTLRAWFLEQVEANLLRGAMGRAAGGKSRDKT